MESAYTLANKELEEIRTKNRLLLQKRRSEVMKKAPQLEDIEKRLAVGGSQLISCVLKRGEGFNEIKDGIKALRSEKASLLVKNGFSADYLDDIYSCPRCADTGFVDGKRCSCLKNLIIKYIGANSNLTERMRHQRFESFDFSLFEQQEGVYNKALKVARVLCEKAMKFSETFDKTGENFLITGNAGTGKTFLSSCIANRALERGKSVYYQTAYKLFETFEKSKFDKYDDSDADETVKYIYDVDLLIIDDLGTEFVTQFTSAVFFDLINTRALAGKSTVISTNLGFEDLSEIYSQRILSRFTGDYNIMQTVGGDLRSILKKIKK